MREGSREELGKVTILCTASSTWGDVIALILSPKKAPRSSLPELEKEALGDKAFANGGVTFRYLG